MFNSKAFWWTSLIFWILGSAYWHVCRIKHLCDAFMGGQAFPQFQASPQQLNISLGSIGFPTYQIDVTEIGQHAIMLTIALLLGFILGNTYEKKKTRELRYRLGRINRELDYYRTKQ
jgi:hypothetical protein